MEKDLTTSLPIQISEFAQVLFFAGVSILSFFVPFAFGHPQWLVGTVVNASLFSGAIYLPKKYFLPLIIFPSLGVLARSLVFGPFTYFLVYFLPFIWLGNLVLILVFKRTGFVAASAAKFLFLFIFANIYFSFHLVPKLFLQTMGIFQLLTALAGGAISYLIFKFYARKFNS